MVLRKVYDCVSYRSKIVPGIQDIWPYFQLYERIFDDCPTLEQMAAVPWAGENRVFVTEGNMRYFTQRNARVIGRNLDGIENINKKAYDTIYFSFHGPAQTNAETKIINAILGGK